MKRHLRALVSLIFVAGCSGNGSSPVAPTQSSTSSSSTRIVNIAGDLAFGNVNVGDSATRPYTISNSGNATLTITSLQAVGGTGVAGFSATVTSGTIGPGSSLTGQIRFAPTAAQGYSNVLTVVGDQTSGNAAVNVSGTGVGSAPAPAPAPSPTLFTITGNVTDGFSGVALTRTQVQITAGANSGQSTGTDGSGNYTLTNLSAGTFTLSVSATGYTTVPKQVSLPGSTRIDFVLPRVAAPTPAPTPTPSPSVFTRSGTGANVFNIPSSVTRIRITGDYSGACQNFVVWIAGRLVVNEILGSCSVGSGRHFEGTYATSGGLAEVQLSTGVSWTFTQVN